MKSSKSTRTLSHFKKKTMDDSHSKLEPFAINLALISWICKRYL